MISGDTSGAFRARNKTRIGTRRVGAFGLLKTGDYPGPADLGGNFIGTEASVWGQRQFVWIIRAARLRALDRSCKTPQGLAMAIVQQHRSDLVKRSRLNAAPVAQWDTASVF